MDSKIKLPGLQNKKTRPEEAEQAILIDLSVFI